MAALRDAKRKASDATERERIDQELGGGDGRGGFEGGLREAIAETLDDTLRIERSIFVDNGGGPLLAAGGDPIPLAVSCTDIFANEAGDWVRQFDGWLGRNGNISVDPIFCDYGNGDYTLRPHSPCAPDSQPDCGRIGALDVGCR